MALYESYKPLRNFLRQFSTVEVLKTVYDLIQFLQYDKPLPAELNHPTLAARPKWRTGLFEWELEILAREAVINGSRNAAKSFRDWKNFSTAINHVKRVENDAWGEKSERGDDIFFEFVRIAHRQFHWQMSFDQGDMTRYIKIYGHAGVAPLVIGEFNMAPHELFQVGLGLGGCFIENMGINTPVTNQLNLADPEVVNRFISRFTMPLDALRTELVALQSFDVNWAYTFNPLWRQPLIRLDARVVACPMLPLLLYRISSGLYFDLVAVPAFANAIGKSFEAYVGAVIAEANKSGSITALPEERYGPKASKKDSIDWIIEDTSATLFVECKSSRVRFQGKFDLAERETMEQEIKRLAQFVVQTYKTLNDALDGAYPHWKPGRNPIYPLILTLDEWHAFGEKVEELVETEVRKLLAAAGIDASILERYPYQICSISDFETLVQVFDQATIGALMAEKVAGETARHPFHNFTVEFIRKRGLQLAPLFPEELDRLSFGATRRLTHY